MYPHIECTRTSLYTSITNLASRFKCSSKQSKRTESCESNNLFSSELKIAHDLLHHPIPNEPLFVYAAQSSVTRFMVLFGSWFGHRYTKSYLE